jgi:phage/plasmid-like protein (TIGR03299 family)
MARIINLNNGEVVNEVSNNNENATIKVSAAQPVAWQGIQGCKSFSTPVTIKEAVEAVGADYNVEKQSLLRVSDEIATKIRNNEAFDLEVSANNLIESHKATVRMDSNKTLGVVGADYGVVQNSKAFEFIDLMTSGTIGGEQRPIIETAGILRDGARMYVTAKLPENIRIDGDKDGISDYLLFTNTHDGSGAVECLFTPIRVICQNTLNMALRGAKNKLVFKHTKNVGDRLDWEREENIQRAVAVLEMHKKYKAKFIEDMTNLRSQKISEGDAMKFVNQIFCTPAELKLIEQNNGNPYGVEEISTRKRNQITDLMNAIENGIGQHEHRGTKLWLLNGLTTFYGNNKKWTTAEDKYNSILDGDVARKVQKGYDFLLAC